MRMLLILNSVSDRMTGSVRLSRQQKWVLDCLVNGSGHQDAETILQHARETGHPISLATIYRALGVLHDRGLIVSSSLGQNHQHFEPVDESTHHHFVCSQCGLIVEIHDPVIDRQITSFTREHGIELSQTRMLLQGLCGSCVKRNSKSRNPKAR